MNKSTSIKLIFPVLFLLIITGSNAVSQTSTINETSTTNLTTSQSVIFPIEAKGKTDPNYEKNKLKSEAFKPYTRSEKNQPLKDKAYYLNLIKELNTDIANREKIENFNGYANDKIQVLKNELFSAEENYKRLNK